MVVFGLCQNALYLGLNFEAMRTVEASVAVVVASLLPLFVAALDWIFLGERLAPLALGGLAAGFAGVLIIMSARLGGGADPVGLSPLLSPACWRSQWPRFWCAASRSAAISGWSSACRCWWAARHFSRSRGD